MAMAKSLGHGQYFGSVVTREAAEGVVITESHYAPRTSLPMHAHERPYLCLVVDGGFEEASSQGRATYGPNSLIFHPAGQIHGDVFGEQGGRCLNIEAPDTWFGKNVEGLARRPDVAEELRAELVRVNTLSAASVSRLQVLLRGQQGSTRPAWLEKIKHRIDQDYVQKLVVEELACDAGVHPVHLSRTFHSAYSATIGDYIRRLRIDLACRELQGSDKPVSQIALEAGFSDQAHLTRMMRSQLGITPAKYRKG